MGCLAGCLSGVGRGGDDADRLDWAAPARSVLQSNSPSYGAELARNGADRFGIYRLFFCASITAVRSEEHTSELQSRENIVCRLLLEKKIFFPLLHLFQLD